MYNSPEFVVSQGKFKKFASRALQLLKSIDPAKRAQDANSLTKGWKICAVAVQRLLKNLEVLFTVQQSFLEQIIAIRRAYI
jgi:hypothetical protein